METINGTKYMTVAETAAFIGIQPGTVRTLVRMGTLADVLPPKDLLIPYTEGQRYKARVAGAQRRPRKEKQADGE